jgi:hypothetical protein
MERLEKAKLVSIDTGEIFPLQFNPQDFTISKTIDWIPVSIKGKESSQTEHSGGQPASFTLKLLFDSTDTGLDVRTQYELLLRMAQPQSLIPFLTRNEPPKCRFIWGPIVSFTAVITNISQHFTMFLGNGMPVRAKVDVTLQEVKSKDEENEARPQNPTSRSKPRKTRRVQLGDRLDLIAFEEYGDVHRWLDIAEANDLENPLQLEAGQILTIPIDTAHA